MRSEFAAIMEAATEGGFWPIRRELPAKNGQGETERERSDALDLR
jgi:predicted RNase H-like HicB family nuclease